MEERTLLELLVSVDSEIQIQAAMQICDLTARQRYRLVEEGVVPPLISMLCCHNYTVVESALFALLRLAFGSDRTKMKIVKSGAVPLLLKLLKSKKSGGTHIDLSSTTLLILSTCSSNKQSISTSGAIPTLLKLLDPISKYKINDQAKQDAMASLQNLSTIKNTKQTIIHGGGVATLLRLFHSRSTPSDLREKALSILETLAAASPAVLNHIAAASTAALVEAMEEGSPETRESAAAILVMMCKRSREKYREMILKEGAMAAVLQMTGEGREVGGELLRLLRVAGDKKNNGRRRSILLKTEALDAIMEEIRAEKVVSALLLVKQLAHCHVA